MPPKNAYRCVVHGCKSKDVTCHRFPNPRTDIVRLKAWMKIVELENEDPHHVYGNKYICSRHFTSNCMSPGTKRLNANAYPSINLPTVQCVQNSKAGQIDLDSSVMSGILELDSSLADSNTIGVTSVQTNKTDHIDLDSSMMSGIVELDSSLADSNTIGVTSVQTNKTDHIDLDSSMMSGIVELDSSLADTNTIDISVDRDNVDSVKHVWNKTKSKASAKTKSNKGLLANIGVRNIRHLTPRCKKFYSITNQLIRNQRQTNSQKELFKNRLKAAEKFADSYMLNKVNGKLTPAASLFTSLQLHETRKKKEGHRFTLDEKMLSLSIYKRSPKCYRLLSTLFTLPCKRTLSNLLATVSIAPGVSPVVLQVLKENVKKLLPSERYCSLIFDEISLSSGLKYDAAADQINGFVNSGLYKSQELADHALVFRSEE